MKMLFILLFALYFKVSYADLRFCVDEQCLTPIYLAVSKRDFNSDDISYAQFTKGENILVYSVDNKTERSLSEGIIDEGRQGYIYANNLHIIQNLNNASHIIDFSQINLKRKLMSPQNFYDHNKRKEGNMGREIISDTPIDEINESIISKLKKEVDNTTFSIKNSKNIYNSQVPNVYKNKAEKINLEEIEQQDFEDDQITFGNTLSENFANHNTHNFSSINNTDYTDNNFVTNLITNDEIALNLQNTTLPNALLNQNSVDTKNVVVIERQKHDETDSNLYAPGISNDLSDKFDQTSTMASTLLNDTANTNEVKILDENTNSDMVETILDKKSNSNMVEAKRFDAKVYLDTIEAKNFDEDTNSGVVEAKSLHEKAKGDMVEAKGLHEKVNSDTIEAKSLDENTNSDIIGVISLDEKVKLDIVDVKVEAKSLDKKVNSGTIEDKTLDKKVKSDMVEISLDETANINASINNFDDRANSELVEAKGENKSSKNLILQKFDVCKPTKAKNGESIRDSSCISYMNSDITYLNGNNDLGTIDHSVLSREKSVMEKLKRSNIIFRFAFLWIDGLSRIFKDASKIYKSTFLISSSGMTQVDQTLTHLTLLQLLTTKNSRIIFTLFFSMCGLLSLFLGTRKYLKGGNEEILHALTSSYENYKMAEDYYSLNSQNEKKIAELQEASDNLQIKLDDFKLRSKEERNKIRRESIASMEILLHEKSFKIDQLKHYEELYNEILPVHEHLQKKVEETNSKILSLISQKLELNEKLVNIEEEYEITKKKLILNELTIAEMTRKYESLISINENCLKEIESFKELFMKLEIPDISSKDSKKLVKPDGKLLQNFLKASELSKETDELRKKISENEAVLRKYEIESLGLQKTITQKQLETDAVKKEIEILETTNKNLEGKIAYVSQYFNEKECNLQRIINDSNSELERSRKDLKSLQKKYEYLDQQKDVYLENLDDSRKELLEIQRETQKKINSLEDVNYKLKMTAHSFERKTNNLQLENNCLRQMLNELENNLDKFGCGNNNEIISLLTDLKCLNRAYLNGNESKQIKNSATFGGNLCGEQLDLERSALSESESMRSSSKSASVGGKKLKSGKHKSGPHILPNASLFYPPPPPIFHPNMLGLLPPGYNSIRSSKNDELASLGGNITDSGIMPHFHMKDIKMKPPLPPFFPLMAPTQSPQMFVSQSTQNQSELPPSFHLGKNVKKKKITALVDSKQVQNSIQFNASGIAAQSSPINNQTTSTNSN